MSRCQLANVTIQSLLDNQRQRRCLLPHINRCDVDVDAHTELFSEAYPVTTFNTPGDRFSKPTWLWICAAARPTVGLSGLGPHSRGDSFRKTVPQPMRFKTRELADPAYI